MTSPTPLPPANARHADQKPDEVITDAESVAALADYLQNGSRDLPAVIVSACSGEQRYPVAPEEIADRLAGRADIFVLESAAVAWKLDLYPALRTYGGAVRVVAAVGRGDVIRTDRGRGSVLARIADAVTVAARTMAPEPGPVSIERTPCTVTPLDLMRRRRGADPVPVISGETVQSAAVAEDAAPESRPVDVATTPGGDGIAGLRRELEQTWNLAASLDADLVAERDARFHAEQEIAMLRTQVEQLRVIIVQLRADSAGTPMQLFSDPEEQFRDDVQRTWLRITPESERAQWALREYRVGPAFLASLDIPQAPRTKIVEVAVDVLTRRAYEMPARSVRPHGDGGPAGTNGQLRRGDGAAGYRANIRTNTPQAPRLMWWELTDGTVELALAGRHDDAMPA